MKQHRDTAPTPTSLRREKQARNKRVRRVATWRNDQLVNEWCGWRIKCEPVMVREFDPTQQVWS